MNSRRTLITNSAMLLGGLFVSGKIFGQSQTGMPASQATPPGTPTSPVTPTPGSPAAPNPANNTGLYQRNYPSAFDSGTMYSSRYSVGYSQGFYNSGYSSSFYGSGYSGFSSGQYN